MASTNLVDKSSLVLTTFRTSKQPKFQEEYVHDMRRMCTSRSGANFVLLALLPTDMTIDMLTMPILEKLIAFTDNRQFGNIS